QVGLDQPENQPHRGDISKMLVHRRARRRGIGAALMRAAEEAARQSGKSLLVLDTASSDAERLYVRHGWVLAGIVADYAAWPRGGVCRPSFYDRELACRRFPAAFPRPRGSDPARDRCDQQQAGDPQQRTAALGIVIKDQKQDHHAGGEETGGEAGEGRLLEQRTGHGLHGYGSVTIRTPRMWRVWRICV